MQTVRLISPAKFTVLAALWWLLIASAGAVSLSTSRPATQDTCSWDRPGHDPFVGDVVAAVDRYRDIPPEVRARLKARMAARSYDEIVSIRRDRIEGRAVYDATITDMHFGANQVCRHVTRTAWTPEMQERGLVYCESGQCLLVPTVCRNVSRITRHESTAQAAPAAAGQPAGEAAPGELAYEPPAAGSGDPGQGAGGGGGGGGGGGPAALGSAGPNSVSAPAWSSPPEQTFAQVARPTFTEPVFVASTPGMPIALAFPGGVSVPGLTPAVPEPQSWALMALGLAAVGWAARRGRR